MVVEVRYVLGQRVFEVAVAAVDDQHPIQQSRRTVPIHRSATAFAQGARTGVRRMRIPSLANTVSKMHPTLCATAH